ncbi:5'-3' exonuclease, partial [Seonamhaeicola marinus]
NIPGLPGVGEKTAKKFLKAYGSMEGLFENIHELKGKMKEKVEANQELGLLSKKLATIMLDVPVKFDEKDFEMCDPDIEAVKTIFQDLEFRRLTENFLKTFAAEDTQATAETTSKTEEKAKPKTTSTAGAGQFSL